MKMISVLKVSRLVLPAIAGCGLLIASVTAKAESGDGTCSDRVLHGAYGFIATGALLNVPGYPAQASFQSVGVARFDGNGHLTWLEHTVLNGQALNPGFASATGTYSLSANCTGTATVVSPNSGPPLSLVFTVVKDGKEIHSLNDTNPVTTAFSKVD